MPLYYFQRKTPRVGFEPTTLRLTAGCSAAELSRNIKVYYTFKTKYNLFIQPLLSRSNPRTVSIGHLNVLLHLQLQPIYLIVSKGSYSFRMGNLILWSASRLDAFSVYQIQTWLLCYAFGKTTDAPVVRPSRSSRTKDSSTQISCAHDG